MEFEIQLRHARNHQVHRNYVLGEFHQVCRNERMRWAGHVECLWVGGVMYTGFW